MPTHPPARRRSPVQRKARRGTTSIEYTMIAGLVAVAIIVALTNLGAIVDVLFTLVAALTTAAI
ncbi:hypothetical protein LBMAG42_52310 [Deltaproteobacteria bacterium]|nr:hypothetical protein LBMAG42_52310 [Deltaproteobacteria bacterium]